MLKIFDCLKDVRPHFKVRRVHCFLLLSALCFGLIGFPVGVSAQVVDIPDPGLRAAIAQALGKAPGDAITRADMETLVELRAPVMEISDLRGIEFATNLVHLTLRDNDISDISPLSNLTKLTHLALDDNDISDISPLSNLTNLEGLTLRDNDISDISPLSNLTKLTHLALDDNDISDISPLARLTNLTHLELRNNNISDVETLAQIIARGTVVYFRGNPAFETPGPKIEEGWVWLIVPATNVNSGVGAARSGRDFLSEASGGALTEAHVAINGARAGTPVGDSVWTAARLDATDRNNLNTLAQNFEIDLASPVAYGVVPIHAETPQQTRVYIGASPAKVWVNGTLVYQNTDLWSRTGYETAVPIQLNAGNNVLFIAAYRPFDSWRWGAFLGFQDGTEYTVGDPGAGDPGAGN